MDTGATKHVQEKLGTQFVPGMGIVTEESREMVLVRAMKDGQRRLCAMIAIRRIGETNAIKCARVMCLLVTLRDNLAVVTDDVHLAKAAMDHALVTLSGEQLTVQ